MQIQNNTEGRTFTDPDIMLQSIAGAEEISAVFPCKLSQFGQKESAAKYTALSILVIIGFIVFINLINVIPHFINHIIIIIGIIVFVATSGRRWLAGYRTRPDALIITSSRLLLVRGVTFKIPQRIHTYEASLEIPTNKSKLKCSSQELIITTSDSFEVGVRQSGFVYTSNSVSTKYYKNKVVSLKAITALLKAL
jgi:hypothetical protein